MISSYTYVLLALRSGINLLFQWNYRMSMIRLSTGLHPLS
eukprot:COSAG02_NODE_43818_length_371_cov_0.992647_1_plen_39_part_01